MMNDDPIIRELREIRRKTEEECEKKGKSYFSHLLEVQDKYKNRLVTDTMHTPSIEKKSA